MLRGARGGDVSGDGGRWRGRNVKVGVMREVWVGCGRECECVRVRVCMLSQA